MHFFLEIIDDTKSIFGKKRIFRFYAKNNLFVTLIYLGEYTSAESLYKVAKVHKNHFSQRANMAKIYTEMGKYSKAENVYYEIFNDYKSYLNKYKNKRYFFQLKEKLRMEYSTILNNLAELKILQGDYTKSEELIKESISIDSTIVGATSTDYAQKIGDLADLYVKTGRLKPALVLSKKALKINQKVYGNSHDKVGANYLALSEIFLKTEVVDSAIFYLNQADTVYKSVFGTNHPTRINILHKRGIIFKQNKQYVEAEKVLLNALKITNEFYEANHRNHALVHFELADIYFALKKATKAERSLLEAKKIFFNLVGNEHPQYLETLHKLVNLYQFTLQYEKAETVLKEIETLSDEKLSRGANQRREIPRNLNANNSTFTLLSSPTRQDAKAGKEISKATTLKNTSNINFSSKPFLNVYAPDPLLKNERGVIPLNAANFTIKGFANAAYGIKHLFINNDTIEIFPDGVWQYPVKLKEGLNTFFIKTEAYSSDVTMDTLQLSYENEEVELNLTPKRYLLAIGINDYNYENWDRLKMPIKDASDLVSTLSEKYSVDKVDTLFNTNASFTNVRNKL